MQAAGPEFGIDDAIVLLLGSDPGPSERRGEIRGITRLEKLVFLLERTDEVSKAMTENAEYKGYNFGPFSQKVYQAIDVLRQAGLVTDSAEASASNLDQLEVAEAAGADLAPGPYSTRDVRLTADGRAYYKALVEELPSEAIEGAAVLRRRFAGWPLRRLVRYVYENYDEFTRNSLIREDILGRD